MASAKAQGPQVSAGLVVALLGLLPLAWLFLREVPSADQPPPTPIEIADLPRTPVEVEPPAVEGLDPAVSRVLYSAGNAGAVGEADAPDLPEEVVRVLVYYDVTLMVPIDGGER